jgi:DNA-binding winged helix-turn-helix (wHTH) protein
MEDALPALDECDILRRGTRWAALAPIEARIIEVLLSKPGRVVQRNEFGVVWPQGMPAERAVDARLTELRARIAPLGLGIRSVRARGLLLDIAQIWDA